MQDFVKSRVFCQELVSWYVIRRDWSPINQSLVVPQRGVGSRAQTDGYVSQRKQYGLPEDLFSHGFKAPGFC